MHGPYGSARIGQVQWVTYSKRFRGTRRQDNSHKEGRVKRVKRNGCGTSPCSDVIRGFVIWVQFRPKIGRQVYASFPSWEHFLKCALIDRWTYGFCLELPYANRTAGYCVSIGHPRFCVSRILAYSRTCWYCVPAGQFPRVASWRPDRRQSLLLYRLTLLALPRQRGLGIWDPPEQRPYQTGRAA